MRFALKLFLWGAIGTGVFGTAAVAFACATDCAIDGAEPNHWAWNDVIGWIDFYVGPITSQVTVNNTELNGYANSSVGFIGVNCKSTPNGDICGTSNFGVTNDGAGKLSGWAWNDNIGWISFQCDAAETDPNLVDCSTVDYGVYIDNDGYFHGWAWNDVVGWISFNALESDSDVLYKVKTTWSFQLPASATLTSSVFDTCPPGTVVLNCGTAGYNAILWRGNVNDGQVNLLLEAGDSATPDATWKSQSFFGALPDIPQKITNAQMQNKRYFRYQATLIRDGVTGQQSPAVSDIIVNWSP